MGRLTPLDAIAAHGIDVPLVTRGERPHGVYLLISAGDVVYVGATSNIETRLTHHLHGLGGCTARKVFDRAIWLPLPREDLPAYEGALIRSLRPALNRRAPAPRGRDLEILGRLGLPPHDEVAADAELRRLHYVPRPDATPRPRVKRKRSRQRARQ